MSSFRESDSIQVLEDAINTNKVLLDMILMEDLSDAEQEDQIKRQTDEIEAREKRISELRGSSWSNQATADDRQWYAMDDHYPTEDQPYPQDRHDGWSLAQHDGGANDYEHLDLSNDFMDDFMPMSRAENNRLPVPQNTSGTPRSSLGGNSASDSSSSLLDPQSRKRPRDSVGSFSPHHVRPQQKSRRTTPSPLRTANTTPSSTSSFEISAEDLEVAKMIFDSTDQAELKELLKAQKREERVARDHKQQELRDEELARSLQGRQSPGPSSAHQNSVQTSLGYRNPSVPLASNSTPTSTASSSAPQRLDPLASSISHPLNQSPMPENNFQNGTHNATPYQMPGSFVDLDDDDDDDDFEVIGSSTAQRNNYFPTNGRLSSNGYNDSRQPDPHAAYSRAFQQMQQHQRRAHPTWDLTLRSLGHSPSYNAHSSSPYLSHPSMNRPGLGTGLGSPPTDPHRQRYGNISHALPGGQIPSGGRMGSNSMAYDLTDENPYVGYSSGTQTWNRFGGMPDPYPSVGMFNHRHPTTANEAAYYDYVTNDPTKTRDEIKSLLENIRPDIELPPADREGTPEAMKYPLMEHQKLGLTWLKNMEEGTSKGGILGDDMGLGKTIQALALMVSRPSSDPRRKTTLIVAPVALMKQWEREIKTKLKTSHRLTTYLFHGPKKKVKWENLQAYDVVLTTFGTLASELKTRESWESRKKMNKDLTEANAPNMPLLGPKAKWYRVIIDEAQCIKNRNTKSALAACHLSSLTRFCLTGTPMMNSVGELHSLIEFLRIKPYNEMRKFNSDFTLALKRTHAGARDSAMRKLQALLKAILLRRTKKSMIDGKPIIQLPERTNETIHAVFDQDQQSFYAALENQTQLQFNKYLKQNSIGRNYSNVLVLLLRLRQACCHPHLIQDFAQELISADLSAADMVELAKELAPEVVARIKETEGFECPVCYDAVENPAIFIPCGHDTCPECFARISAQTGIQGLEEGIETSDIKCPQCRGKISPKKIVDYLTFKKVHMPAMGIVDAEPSAVVEDSETDSDEDEDSDDSSDSLDGFVVPDDVENDDDDIETPTNASIANFLQKGAVERQEKVKSEGKKQKSKKKDKQDPKGKGKATPKTTKSLAQLKKEGMRNVKARRKYMRRLDKEWIPSAKLDKCCEILEKIHEGAEREKTIVFSQFTSLLDLLEVPLARKRWVFKRYDGSMSATQRNDAIMEFTDKPDCRIMLVSLKAGNAGLNLVAASQVIILDPFWNPFIEEQAIDRTHRIGQLRPVKVHRILVQETVEDRIIALQEKKRELIEGALDEKASQSIGRLGTRELAFLFGVQH
ncbi:MAG: GTP-binding nuclear protein gsp1/Ran [Chaenotheca gracillima]|nr:MAG: GTP-binding nuclear protein gsp1/Ran [Chaenotheca gracillima]